MLGVGAMRCLACGAEMTLTEVVRDDTMMVPGYEDQTFECPGCHEVERRRMFRGEAPSEAASIAADPSPAAALSDATSSPATAAVVAAPVAPAASVQEQAVPEQAMLMHAAPSASPAIADADAVDEGEEMLRRAIAMVRSPLRGAQPIQGLTDRPRKPAAPAALAGPMRATKPGSVRVVQIRHDPSFDAAYAAKDTNTGLVVLRHQDSARLRSMCDRLGWQVIEDGAVVGE